MLKYEVQVGSAKIEFEVPNAPFEPNLRITKRGEHQNDPCIDLPRIPVPGEDYVIRLVRA